MIRGKRIFQRIVLAVELVESSPLTSEKMSTMLTEDGPLAKAIKMLKINMIVRTEQRTGSFLVIGVIGKIPVLFCNDFT